MLSSRDVAYKFTMGQEGGWSVDPHDSGNWSGGAQGSGTLIGSNFGVTAQSLAMWRRPALITATDMAALSEAEAEAIFMAQTWQPMWADNLPAGPDLSAADMGYNAGERESAMILQTIVGVTADGWIGPETIAAIAKFQAPSIVSLSAPAIEALQQRLGVGVDGIAGPVTRAALNTSPKRAIFLLIARLADAQETRYRSLAQFSLYGDGWTERTWQRAAAALAIA